MAAQIGWGTYPVMLRYLQTISGIPGFSLLAVANFLVFLVAAVTVLPRIDRSVFRRKFVWAFAMLVVLRAITNMLAVRFTLAIYVQMIYLMTPFVVALISRAVLHEQLPRHTVKALLVALLGAVLILWTGVGETAVSVGRNDLLGIGIAIFSMFTLSVYMITARRAAHYHVSADALLVAHFTAISSVSFMLSFLVGEEWSAWRQLQPTDWALFLFLTFAILLGANVGQIHSIRRLGAPLVSSVMALRLVSSLIFAGLLLGEWLTTGWQVVGAVIIVVTITVYLRQQKRGKKQSTINS